ncbi:MAG: hypothetical protein ACK5PW_11440 [Burkholderiales bacterium]|jgi:hypothetical protein
MAASARHRHHVYVVLLEDRVMNDRSYARANPGWDATRPCLYVGMTGLTPELRLARHKAGVKANRYVREHGLRLLPELYAWANPMPYEAAREMEVELAIGLRAEGYAVWQA